MKALTPNGIRLSMEIITGLIAGLIEGYMVGDNQRIMNLSHGRVQVDCCNL